MGESPKIKVSFNAPLQPGDTTETMAGCRANNPGICKNNGIPEVCAFECTDGICRAPSKAWKKQFLKLSVEGNNDAE